MALCRELQQVLNCEIENGNVIERYDDHPGYKYYGIKLQLPLSYDRLKNLDIFPSSSLERIVNTGCVHDEPYDGLYSKTCPQYIRAPPHPLPAEQILIKEKRWRTQRRWDFCKLMIMAYGIPLGVIVLIIYIIVNVLMYLN